MRRICRPNLVLAGVLLLTAGSTRVSTGGEREDIAFFESKIRPVLVERCYGCHATGAKKVGGGLLLDSREGVLRGGESGPALVPGRPEESLIVSALRWSDELEMPPEDPLPETVVHDFIEWIRRGASDPRSESESSRAKKLGEEERGLWSFEPVRDPPPPAVSNVDWPRDAIDEFTLARLESQGLRPTGDASAAVLIRRLYSDLTGLAPTFDEVESFRSEYAQNARHAVRELVDRLLADSGFGERWGRHWLDVARYGESNGNDGLGRNPTFPHAWRYRNYVIDAFNRDLPYDRFITEQIAGDLLPAQTNAERNRQLVATGFLAIGWKPAVAMNQNFAMDVVEDQIDAVSSAVLGLSVACARCHDHKHDPIPTRDYYALAGIFRSTETLWGKAANEGLTAPATPLHELLPEATEEQRGAGPFVLPLDYSRSIDALRPVVHERLDSSPESLTVEKGVRFSREGFASTKEGRLRSSASVPSDAYSVAFWFRNDLANDSRPITAYLFSHAKVGDQRQIGDHLGIGGTHDKSKTGKLFLWNGQGADEVLKGRVELPTGDWHHVVLVRDGRRVRVHLNGEAKPELEGEAAPTAPEDRSLIVGARNDRFAPLFGALAEIAVFDRALTPEETNRLHSASGRPRGTRSVQRKRLAMGVREAKKIESCKINIDGNSKKLGPEVARGFLSACRTPSTPPSIEGGSSGRLELARWLVSGDHPQTARVIVNRVWLHLFGRGLVSTPDDFGFYGARPSHPDLLDHLASRFVRGGWSIKKLVRSIVLSRTYQLASVLEGGASEGQALLNRDSENIWLGRHRRRRLDAESLRDRILQSSGELDRSPRNGSDIDSVDALINWPPGEARYLHRPSLSRSVYLCMLRDSPPPELAAFDLPDGLAVTGQRDVTTSASQTLFLLNSPFVVARSRALAQALLEDAAASKRGRVERAYRHVLARDPTEAEVQRSVAYLADTATEFGAGDEAELRAWASFCQALFATSEFRYID